MQPVYTFWTAVVGSGTASVSVTLNPAKRYLVTGGLILASGDDQGRIYIGQVCRLQGAAGPVLCGVRDVTGDAGLGLVEFVDQAVGVTIKLRATGGRHRGEGVIYQL